jgi:ADP-ribose pyrophosphatase
MTDPVHPDVNLVDIRLAYKGFFAINVFRLQFRRFCGEWSETIAREMFERGASVAVIPYDPVRDEVILIRQVAVREAEEEAGCAIRTVVKAASFLPSPGGSSELIHVFVARADASIAGGIHGLAVENEDIRVEVYSSDEAIRMLDSGEIEAGPAVVGLLWFARMRDQLRKAWLAGE